MFSPDSNAWLTGWRDALFGYPQRHVTELGREYELGYITGFVDRAHMLKNGFNPNEKLKHPNPPED